MPPADSFRACFSTRVIDDDVSVPSMASRDDDSRLEAADEAPQVAAVTSDAPPQNADKRWKTLEECDLEELESQREILSESLKMLQEDDPARDLSSSGDDAPPQTASKSAARRRHDSESSEDSRDGGGGGDGSSGSESSSDSDSGPARR